MIVICEECGKKYRIDPSKIKGKAASFKCRACTHLIVVTKPAPPIAEPFEPQPAPKPKPTLEAITTTVENEEPPTEAGATSAKAAGGAPADRPRRTGRFGLRAKMLLLFLLIPLMLMGAASFLYLWQLDATANMLTREGAKFVNQMAEEKIASVAEAVAKQCRLYLLAHPELQKEDFKSDPEFKVIAVQKVGLTGYTALYQLPGSDGVWRTWAHINPKIIGIDMSKLEKPLGINFPGFWKVFSGVKGGKLSQGYYTWQDPDGKFRDKFMVCTPIAGTRFVIAATTYMDEFTGPVKMMQSTAAVLSERAQMISWAILGATLLLVGLIVFIYSQRITGKIKSLTEVADRISVGELDMEVDTRSKDEIGELADAIARMQESIRLSIERLRRRRQ
jgi:predicted Zn finger-like uncharacterized protein